MRTHKIHPHFNTITANSTFTPNADSLCLVNRGDDVQIGMNNTSMTLKPGEDLTIDANDCEISDEITISFLGTAKELLIIEGRKESILN